MGPAPRGEKQISAVTGALSTTQPQSCREPVSCWWCKRHVFTSQCVYLVKRHHVIRSFNFKEADISEG